MDHPGDDLELIGKVCRGALWSTDLSVKEKTQMAISTKKLFTERGLKFNDEPKLTLFITSSSGTTPVTLTLSQAANSSFLTNLWSANYSETLNPQKSEPISIILPDVFTVADFIDYINADDLDKLSAPELNSVFFLSCYFHDIERGNRCLDILPSLLPSSETDLENLLIATPTFIPELANRYASLIMQKYIKVRLKEGDTIEQIAKTIQNNPKLKEAISKVSLDLDLQNLISSSHDLILLASVIPNVRSLNLSRSNIDSLPLVWKDSLQHLNISETAYITSIPAGFTCLESFDASFSPNLIDISGLNGSRSLKVINIDETAVASAPHDCHALEIFSATETRTLTDISGLSGSPSLREINIRHTAVTAIPKDIRAQKIRQSKITSVN